MGREVFDEKKIPVIFGHEYKPTNPDPMFIHHVYFWLKEGLTQEEREKFVRGLQAMTQISYLKLAHIGVPAATDRAVIDSSYSYSWLLIFDNKVDQDTYQEDPIHLKFIEDCASLWERVLVYDSVSV